MRQEHVVAHHCGAERAELRRPPVIAHDGPCDACPRRPDWLRVSGADPDAVELGHRQCAAPLSARRAHRTCRTRAGRCGDCIGRSRRVRAGLSPPALGRYADARFDRPCARHRPRLLLLDEPFAALDEITRMALNDDLLHLWRNRRPTVVFVTHSVFESVYLSTRIAVMSPRPGRITAELPVELPQPRERALRTSPDYVALCAQVSRQLATT